jgi:hypothetical protein
MRAPKTMNRRYFIVIAMVAALGLVLFEAHTHVLRGYLAGEPFYRGKPASYWSRELARWEGYRKAHIIGNLDSIEWSAVPKRWSRSTLAWEEWLYTNVPSLRKHLPRESRILDGDLAAFDVLLVLLEAENAQVRAMAAHGLSHFNRRESVAALMRCLKDPDEEVRIQARAALKNIDH